MMSAHARRYSSDANSTIATQASSAKDYVTPTLDGAGAQVAAASVSVKDPVPERDLSGFGDAAIDDIDIDD